MTNRIDEIRERVSQMDHHPTVDPRNPRVSELMRQYTSDIEYLLYEINDLQKYKETYLTFIEYFKKNQPEEIRNCTKFVPELLDDWGNLVTKLQAKLAKAQKVIEVSKEMREELALFHCRSITHGKHYLVDRFDTALSEWEKE